ncbi:MAG: TIGR00270 family protein [Candidatus Bathyarchaeum sp.]|nr:MAG: TIGR00270 family protein [Candidatus Bathyarchaeum sp.]
MQCEVCGRQIFGTPVRAIIEGAKMTVCSKCGKLSSGYWEPKPQPQPRTRTITNRQAKPISYSKRQQMPTVPETLELASDLGQRVRKARRELEMSHEDLGRKIREKVSLIRKIESGKMIPDNAVVEKLEHALKIKLRVPAEEPKVQSALSSKPQGTTLGDLIQFKVKNKEAKK